MENIKNSSSVLAAAALAAVIAAPASGQSAAFSNLGAVPSAVTAGIGTQVVVSARISDPNVIPASVVVQRLSATGAVLGTLGPLKDDGAAPDTTAADMDYAGRVNIFETAPGSVRMRISAGIRGSISRIFSSVFEVRVNGTPTTVRITAPARDAYLSLSPVQVSGTIADASLNVTVNGIAAVKNGLAFTASVPLIEGTNTLTAVALGASGSSSSDSIQVVLDTTPPRVTIMSPADGYRTTSAGVGVSGIVNDIVVGTVNPQQATVNVNGTAALVSNRTFAVNTLPLALGNNQVRAEGRDRAGNTYAQTITVVRDPVPAGVARLELVSGNNQSGPINSQLPLPLIVRLLNAQGQPAANTLATFRVTDNNGLVNNLPAVSVAANAQGLAQVAMKLGSRSGAGSNRVEAFATGFTGTALFAASGVAGAPVKLVQDSGLNQTGTVGQLLPFPFVAVVTDAGSNRLAGVPVAFTVRAGGGTLNGATQQTVMSDSDGRVMVTLKLGLEEGWGNNVVGATFTGNPSEPAIFSATALTPGPAANTTISGVVLDNSDQPIPNVTIRLYQLAQGAVNVQPLQIAPPVVTNALGRFQILNAPVGTMKLMADGTTALPAGGWPTLEYDLVTVAGRDNTVGMPIYLPRLDTVNRLCVTSTTGGTLTLPQVPGFSLTIAPGSATFPGGSRTGCVSVTPVNPDKVPMVPGFGQQPRFVVTIQPVGTQFNPPAAITIPNVDGLSPRSKTEMYSYDHDLASFVAIGTGTVSEDGSVISSDPGVGVIKAGWHCGGNPNPTGSAATCPDCNKCVSGTCAADSAKNDTCCDERGLCRNGTCDPVQGAPCPANTAVVPGVNNLGDWAGCTAFGLTQPKTPQTPPNVTSCIGAACTWGFRVNSFTSDLYAGVCGPAGHIDVTGANIAAITAATYCAAIVDLTPDATGRPSRGSYWSSSITRRHENFHVTEWTTALTGRWPAYENGVEGFTVPFGPTAKTAAQAKSIKQADIDAAFATLLTNTAQDWNATGENPAYADGKASYDALVAAICTRARTEGWVKTNPCASCPP